MVMVILLVETAQVVVYATTQQDNVLAYKDFMEISAKAKQLYGKPFRSNYFARVNLSL
jgi:hypothetical protein